MALSIVGKPTAQSSNYGSYTSEKAADGNRDTRLYPNYACTCTRKYSHRL